MGPTSISIEGMPGVRRMLAPYDGSPGKMQNKLRRAVRAGAKPFQVSLKVAAAEEPTGNVPDSFMKVPAAKVSTRRGASGREIEARVRPKSPLFNIFEPGAVPHEIDSPGVMGGPAGEGGWTNEGRKRPGAFAARGRVRHPGMRARPLLPVAFSRGRGAALMAATHVLFGAD